MSVFQSVGARHAYAAELHRQECASRRGAEAQRHKLQQSSEVAERHADDALNFSMDVRAISMYAYVCFPLTQARGYRTRVQVDGMEAQDLSIEVSTSSLIIQRHVHDSTDDKHIELCKLALPEGADATHMSASLKHGVLHVRVPKASASAKDKRHVMHGKAAEASSLSFGTRLLVQDN
jgi:hypothetical protein